LTATDAGSGGTQTYYKINSGPVQSIASNGQPYITTEDANNTLECWSVDNAGNDETHRFLTEIELDKTNPVIGTPLRNPTGDAQPGQEVIVTIDVSDTTSSVKNVTLHYTTNNGTTWTNLAMNHIPPTDLYNATIPDQPLGTVVKFKIVAYDNAGNRVETAGTGVSSTYQVIPEFQPFTLLLIFMILAATVVILAKTKTPRRLR
jgi:hypothetical protein